MSKYDMLIGLAIGLVVGGLFLGQSKNNQTLEYGDSGFPKNCRALIKANIDGYRNNEYSAEEAIQSIDRNCGEFGYIWNE